MASLAAGRARSVGAIDNFVNLDGARPAWGLVLIASTLRDCPNRGSFGADFAVARLSYRRLSPRRWFSRRWRFSPRRRLSRGRGGNGGYYGHNHDYGGYDACALNPFYLLNPGYPYSC